MNWRKKKQLTREELVAEIRSEVAHDWFNGQAQFATLPNEANEAKAFPLEANFASGTWLVFFVDPTDYAGETALRFARELHQRLSIYNTRVVLLLQPIFEYLDKNDYIESFLKHWHIQFSTGRDRDQLISRAFSINEFPSLILFNNGKAHSIKKGIQAILKAEVEIHQLLRVDDPGLPLPAPLDYSTSHDWFTLSNQLNLGFNQGAVYPSPGFKEDPAQPLFRFGDFPAKSSMADRASLVITGKWLQSAHSIRTSDPNATLAIHSPHSHLALIAKTLGNTDDPAKVIVKVNGNIVHDPNRDTDISLDDEGRSIVRISKHRNYHLLTMIPVGEREVSFLFPYAHEIPVELYGLRFGG